MRITIDKKSKKATFQDGTWVPINCSLRTLAAGTREKHEVVFAIDKNFNLLDVPIDPVEFPSGSWRVTGRTPIAIETDAFAEVDRYSRGSDGNYFQKVGKTTTYGYAIHLGLGKEPTGCVVVDKLFQTSIGDEVVVQ